MRHLARGLAMLAFLAGPASIAAAQATKPAPTPTKPAAKAEKAEAKPSAEMKSSGGFRTLTGTIGEIQAGGKTLTVELPEAGAKGARAAQTWTLATGKQTLMLRAGKNGQYSTIEFDGLAKGETVQAVAELEADADKSHRAWWLIAYPAGTTPPAR